MLMGGTRFGSKFWRHKQNGSYHINQNWMGQTKTQPALLLCVLVAQRAVTAGEQQHVSQKCSSLVCTLVCSSDPLQVSYTWVSRPEKSVVYCSAGHGS